jgi:PIN domain nuclease of toxin-antitoxin system
MLNLDTHILLGALSGELTSPERRILAAQEWCISDIVIWEIAKLAELGRIDVDLEDPELSRLLAGIRAWPISLDVCRAIGRLDFDSDPADEIIAATSLAYRIPLLTRDRLIRKSLVVPLATT